VKKWRLIVGIGLALVPLHNQQLTELTTVNGRVLLFLPTLGYLLLYLGTALFLLRYWDKVKETGFGDKKIWISLLVIVAAMGVSGAVNGNSFSSRLAPLFMGLALFAVYLMARVLGPDIFKYLVPFVIVGSISVVILGLAFPGQYTGGFITNYCASAGYLIFGALVYQGRWKLALICIAGVGLFFIGALEAVFIIGVVIVTILIRRDFGLMLALGFGVLMILIGIWAALGHLTPLYEGNGNLMALWSLITGDTTWNPDTAFQLTSGRWEIIVDSVKNFSFIGHGYSLSTVGGGIVHNIPLIIMHQVGPFAALAWLFVTLYCVIKTGWKYIWIAVIAMCVWDHYLWTQMTPWWWALVGVTTAHNIRRDWIFKHENLLSEQVL
jgi:hypothetical protein